MNLIITCARSLESETKNEISKILDELGDQEPEILNVGMRGILMVNTIIEPSKIIDYVKNKIIEEPLKDVYTVPFFSEKFCNILLDEMKHLEAHFGFNPNPEEDNLRQIPEITFQDNCPQIFQSLMQTIYTIGNPIFLNIWNRHVDSGGIQIANYNLKDKKQGAWHHDASADISMVVPLNTGKYKGGGTEFLKRGTVEPLPTGHALIFPSFTHMHRGLAVESGDRYLLVFWLKCLQE